MGSTWTDEMKKRLASAWAEAMKSFDKATSDFWKYIVEKVGEGKTVEDVKEECNKLDKEGQVPISEYVPMSSEIDQGKA
ncbi:hypothetical protein ACHQM5_005427 [Ranunculus cassubicifolius]